MPQKNKQILSARLSAVAECLGAGEVFCDVGSDHGYLPAYLLQKGLYRKAIVTDIHTKPLEKARAHLTKTGLSDRAVFCLADGVVPVLDEGASAYAICGMSGETIAAMIVNAAAQLPAGTRLVAQPMTHEEVLRKALYQSGFQIEKEVFVQENGKVFLILSALFDGVIRDADETKIAFGELDAQTLSPEKNAYLSAKKRALVTKLHGKKRAGLNTDREERLLSFLAGFMEG